MCIRDRFSIAFGFSFAFTSSFSKDIGVFEVEICLQETQKIAIKTIDKRDCLFIIVSIYNIGLWF